jgi:class 3 adenylate cyclase
VRDFLAEDAETAGERRTGGAMPTGAFRTILFTDLVGHTEMMRRLGDDRGREVLREHERITRDLLKEHGGAEVKTMGDGFMASFASVTKAMDCAIALQRAFASHEGEPLQVRVGLNAGEPIEENGDLFGSTVIMASRIAAKAGAGEILIPEPLRHLLTGKSYVYADRGDSMLKGFEDAVRLYEVRWTD